MMKEKNIYIIDSKEYDNLYLKRRLQNVGCKYIDDFQMINKNNDYKVVFVINDYKDCLLLFKFKEYRHSIIIASDDREIISILKNNTSYLGIIDLKKQKILNKQIHNYLEL
ncbi:hypothetical protein M0M57_11650 [Flavobacterium azooxidireducens]|uniref:Uncharacterized protein n=1 Tax=Flavobacterium azooxidireducens TaxID=1871076 RepID=A0ABY4KBW2_9FLAO|nr:hypothetical protein [Flavobacterium azooxidireducens]UPQ78272.1 hypothetical protein M0M57_11650 [Flavobacterium azooxidireducens]